MNSSIGSVNVQQNVQLPPAPERSTTSTRSQAITARDSVSFGETKISDEQSNAILLERAYEKLRGVVETARTDLGYAPGEEIDISAEATAGRIVDFGLGAFETFQKNNPELEGKEARTAFAELIGGAIEQGISEARGILESLAALSEETDSKINSIADIISQRLQEFVAG